MRLILLAILIGLAAGVAHAGGVDGYYADTGEWEGCASPKYTWLEYAETCVPTSEVERIIKAAMPCIRASDGTDMAIALCVYDVTEED